MGSEDKKPEKLSKKKKGMIIGAAIALVFALAIIVGIAAGVITYIILNNMCFL